MTCNSGRVARCECCVVLVSLVDGGDVCGYARAVRGTHIGTRLLPPISNCGIGDTLAVTLAEATPDGLNPFRRVLLSDNRLSDRGVPPLLGKLASSFLTHLDLSQNQLGSKVRNVHHVVFLNHSLTYFAPPHYCRVVDG